MYKFTWFELVWRIWNTHGLSVYTGGHPWLTKVPLGPETSDLVIQSIATILAIGTYWYITTSLSWLGGQSLKTSELRQLTQWFLFAGKVKASNLQALDVRPLRAGISAGHPHNFLKERIWIEILKSQSWNVLKLRFTRFVLQSWLVVCNIFWFVEELLFCYFSEGFFLNHQPDP